MWRRYVVIYFSILYIRYRLGIVTDEMLAIPKWRFLIIGFLEALGVLAGMSSGGIVSACHLDCPFLFSFYLSFILIY